MQKASLEAYLHVFIPTPGNNINKGLFYMILLLLCHVIFCNVECQQFLN